MRRRTARHLAYAALHYGGRIPGPPAWLENALSAVIVISVVSLVLATEPTLWSRLAPLFIAVEAVSVLIFIAEYIARLWSITEHREYRHPVWGRLRYALTPMMLIDLLAIAPSLITLGLADMRVLRAVRLVRLLKFSRHNEIMKLFMRVLRDRTPELATACVAALGVLLVSATLMYMVEGDEQPEKFGSIPRSMWWSIVTITTLGYGDVTPVTALGKVIAALTAAIGIGVIAVPTALLSSGLTEALSENRRRRWKIRERRRGRRRNTAHTTNTSSKNAADGL